MCIIAEILNSVLCACMFYCVRDVCLRANIHKIYACSKEHIYKSKTLYMSCFVRDCVHSSVHSLQPVKCVTLY